jgi:peptidoglycan/LPS O-acetylase OafA/YrhL
MRPRARWTVIRETASVDRVRPVDTAGNPPVGGARDEALSRQAGARAAPAVLGRSTRLRRLVASAPASVHELPHVRNVYVDAPNVAPPPGNPRFALFDSLRAIAALSVFAGHSIDETRVSSAHTFSAWAFQIAAQGVAIFFLISGFLLYRPFLVARRGGRHVTVREYARRRVLRILPAYWLALLVVELVIQHPNGITVHNWWIIYGFGQVYSQATIGNGIGAAWTLCVEVTFYALLPLLVYAGARLGGGDRHSLRGDVLLLIVLAIASIAFHTYVYASNTYAFWSGTLPGTFYWFALGMGLAIASVLHEERPRATRPVRVVIEHPSFCWLAALVLFVLLYVVLDHPGKSGAGDTGEHLLYGLVALLVLAPAVFGENAGGFVRRVLGLRWLAWLGVISYGFYLYHSDIIAAVISRLAARQWPHPYLVVLVGSFLATCLFASASYYLVERPILRLKNRPLGSAFRPRGGSPRDKRPASRT